MRGTTAPHFKEARDGGRLLRGAGVRDGRELHVMLPGLPVRGRALDDAGDQADGAGLLPGALVRGGARSLDLRVRGVERAGIGCTAESPFAEKVVSVRGTTERHCEQAAVADIGRAEHRIAPAARPASSAVTGTCQGRHNKS